MAMDKVGSMPHGFFTVEQRKGTSRCAASHWVPVKHFDACNTLTGAMATIEAEGRPGLFRMVQAHDPAERIVGKLHLDRKHAGSQEALERSVQAFERDGGKWIAAKRPRKKK
jgi:hypothetical protein